MSVAAALAVAGCATTVSGHGGAALPPTPPGPSAFSTSSADFPSASATSSVPAPAPSSSSAAPLASQDITDVHWRIPPGFAKGHGYHPVTPLEHHYSSGYIVPANERAGLDVISIVLYRLPSYIPVNTILAQKVRVRYYNDLAHARTQSGLHVESLQGWPAIQENAIERNKYRYAAWFVFSRRHVLEVSCQVDQQVNKLARGCQAVLKSMKLS
ncbi:MAG TPA: hypothetical protein VE442_25845 [Jatrophihabitans sp.]|nr:hypothetical protein [Jatrophihabitans sp.]